MDIRLTLFFNEDGCCLYIHHICRNDIAQHKELFKIFNVFVPTLKQIITVQASEEESDDLTAKQDWNAVIGGRDTEGL